MNYCDEREKMKATFVSFFLENSTGINKDAISNLFNQWAIYDESKILQIQGLIQNCETHIKRTHDDCTYRKMEGEGYFKKADNYVKERLKVAGLIVGIIILLATYNLGQISNKIDNIDKNLTALKLDFTEVKTEVNNLKRVVYKLDPKNEIL